MSIRASIVLCSAAALCPSAQAVDLNSGGDWQVRWDNTLRYSAGYRLASQDSRLIEPVSERANADDGDRSFDTGLISSRLDLLSEFDVQKDGFGLRISGAAWYDDLYNRPNNHDSAISANRATVAFNEFSPGTREIAGRNAELLDLFVFGAFDLGDRTLSARLGQHSLIWGTSLFFGMNGIAKGMGPIDVYKLSIPGTQAKETTMPVPRLSAMLQLTDDTSIEAHVQFDYEPTRLHPAGSYLSSTDMLGDGAERMFIGSPTGNRCGDTAVPPPQRFNNCFLDFAGIDEGKEDNNFGIALNTVVDWIDSDLGLYAVRYRDTSTVIQTNTGAGTYSLLVPEKPIDAFGFSLSSLIGDANVGIEASVRKSQPLVAKEGVVSNTDPSYAKGRTAHLNVSWVMLMPKGGFWDGASLLGEFAANTVLDIDEVVTTVPGRFPTGTEKVNRDRNRSSGGVRVIFTPSWYQTRPGLDISLPINLGWSFRGRSMIDNSFPFSGSPDRSGEISLGVRGVYLNRWTMDLTYINFIGRPERQPVADRDYLRLSIQTTF